MVGYYGFTLAFVSLLVLAVGLFAQTERFRVHKFLLLVYLRGMMAPNRFWWRISETIHDDLNGAKLFHQLKPWSSHFKRVSTLGRSYHLVYGLGAVREILDGSPLVFGVGQLKFDFFKSFMPENVGVSQGCPWKTRRVANETVLATQRVHPLIDQVESFFQKSSLPTVHGDFGRLGEGLALKLVFGDVADRRLFGLFREANGLEVFWGRSPSLPSHRHLVAAIDQTRSPESLLGLARRIGLDRHELLQQAPHWLFPINGLITVTLPRVLALLALHPDVLRGVRKEMASFPTVESLLLPDRQPLLRRCILETLRLNNTVTSMFRTLLRDYRFRDGTRFPKGSNFLILIAGFLRDPAYFPEPDEFRPERWSDPRLESSYANLIWSQGPQVCPGKRLSLDILQATVHTILRRTNRSRITAKGVTPNLDPFSLEISYRDTK
jgi:hypothetical protein